MGRKAAPQPLSLGLDVRPSDDDYRAAETIPGSARLPPDTATPRSPRSPFRYGQNNLPENVHTGEPLQPLADVLHQSQRSLEPPQEQQRRQQHPDAARDPPHPSPRAHSADHQQQLGHRHQRRGDDKASKSGFFFNFGKTAKPSDRPIVHQHSNSRTEAMSRDSDRTALSKQSTKHSGKQANILYLCYSAFDDGLESSGLVDPALNGADTPGSPSLVSSCANDVGPES
jgi:hypothetical protein